MRPVGAVHALQEPKPTTATGERASPTPCYRCGSSRHSASICRFRSVDCHKCGKKGHLARVCRSQEQKQTRQWGKQSTNLLSDTVEPDKELEDADMYTLFNLKGVSAAPFRISVVINNASLDMEVDTGAAASVISEVTYNKLWVANQRPSLKHTNIGLRTYTGERLPIRGKISVEVCYQTQRASLTLLVIGGEGPSLMGRDWIGKFNFPACLNRGIFHTSSPSALQGILDKHQELFKEGLGLLKGTLVKIHVDENATPLFYKPRTVPYALREGRKGTGEAGKRRHHRGCTVF